MTPKDKLRALLAKAEELETKATKGPWSVNSFKVDDECIDVEIRGIGDVLITEGLGGGTPLSEYFLTQEADFQLMALSRNSFLPVLRLLVKRLDVCPGCLGKGFRLTYQHSGDDEFTKFTCEQCIPRYAALCAELEKLGVMEIDIPA